MKPIVRLMPFALLVVALLFICGCGMDRCTGIECQNGGSCIGDGCRCPTGYEGNICETASRRKLMGNWKVYEDGSATVPREYPASIEAPAGSDPTDVVLNNFYNYFLTPVKALLIKDTLLIPEQQYQGKTVVGKGWVHNDSIYMRYRITDSATNLVDDFGYDAAPASGRRSVWYR